MLVTGSVKTLTLQEKVGERNPFRRFIFETKIPAFLQPMLPSSSYPLFIYVACCLPLLKII